MLLVLWGHRQGHEGRAVGGTIVCRCSKQGVLRWTRQLLRRAHPWPHRDGAGPGIVEGVPHRGVAGPTVVAGAVGVVVLAFLFPLPLALTLAFTAVVSDGGRRGRATGRHGSSCCSGDGGSCCYGGCPPPEGVEWNAEACPWAAELSSSISSISRSLWMVWKEGNSCDCLMKIFM
jgi:hypothetical protein